jgi:transcriptional regulator with XRE-family HTH domain
MPNRSKARPDLKAIGSRVRSLRGRMQQEVFASELGLSQGQLSKVERGKSAPTLETLLRLASAFGKTLDWIVLGKD